MKKTILFIYTLFAIIQAFAQDEFITVWQLPVGQHSLQFYLEKEGGDVNYSWETIPAAQSGQGVITSNGLVNIFGLPSTGYMIRLRLNGTYLKRFYSFNGSTPSIDRNKLLDVEQWGTARWKSMQFAFYECKSLNISAVDLPDLSEVQRMDMMFFMCETLSRSTKFNEWDVSNVQNFDFMFFQASSFNQNIGTWNLANAQTMGGMLAFCGMDCSTYSTTLSGWANNPITANGVFLTAEGLTYGSDGEIARSLLVTEKGWIIYGDNSSGQNCDEKPILESDFVTLWQTSSNQLYFDLDRSGETAFYWETIPLDQSGSGVFPAGSGSVSITELPKNQLIKIYINPEHLWRFSVSPINDENLLDVLQWGSARWHTMEDAFSGCSNLNITAADLPNLSIVSNMNRMFYLCESLNGPHNINEWDVSFATTMSGMFAGAISFNQPIGSWNVSSVFDMSGMFGFASAFNQPIGDWNVSSVDHFYYMFQNAISFNQPIDRWDVSHAMSFMGMFEGASAFNQVIGNWTYSKSMVANLEKMLDSCGMDCTTYSSTLIGWSNNNMDSRQYIRLGANGMQYGAQAESARDYLVTNKLWSIIGDSWSGECGNYIHYQLVDLQSGWNIFSSTVLLDQPDMKTVLQPLIDQGKLSKVMNEAGSSFEYIFGNWRNNIGNMLSTEGYKIKVNADAELQLEGVPVAMPHTVPLNAGWNIISFPTSGNQDGLAVLQALINEGKLKKVMDEGGKSIEYVFGQWRNNIGDFIPGKGYKVNVNAACELILTNDLSKSAMVVPELLTSNHFRPVFTGNGTDHMNINLVELAQHGLMEGDEIGIFDGELCVGSASIGAGHMAQDYISIPVSRNDGLQVNVNGYVDGNPVALRIFRYGTESALSFNLLDGRDHFVPGESMVASPAISAIHTFPQIVDELEVSCYPNPFSDFLNIVLHSKEPGIVKVEVYDITGKRLNELYKGVITGSQTIRWNGTDVRGNKVLYGNYFIKVNDQIVKLSAVKQ